MITWDSIENIGIDDIETIFDELNIRQKSIISFTMSNYKLMIALFSKGKVELLSEPNKPVFLFKLIDEFLKESSDDEVTNMAIAFAMIEGVYNEYI